MGRDIGKCRACPAMMIWAQMFELDGTPKVREDNGKPVMNPLDLVPLADPSAITASTHAIAYNERTGGATAVVSEALPLVASWAEQGVTFHLSHFATCPERGRFKRGR